MIQERSSQGEQPCLHLFASPLLRLTASLATIALMALVSGGCGESERAGVETKASSQVRSLGPSQSERQASLRGVESLEAGIEAASKTNSEAYNPIEENAFRQVGDDPLSTFSIDVDTASYSNVRRFLGEHAPPGERHPDRGDGQLLPLQRPATGG